MHSSDRTSRDDTPTPPSHTNTHTHRHKHTQSHSHHIIAYTHATCGCSGERHPCDTKIQTLDNKHMRADASGRAIVRPKQAVAHARRQPCHSDASLRTREQHCQNMPGSFPDKRLKGLAAQTRQPEAKCDRIQTHPMQPHLRSLHLRPPTKGVADEATTASEAARGWLAPPQSPRATGVIKKKLSESSVTPRPGRPQGGQCIIKTCACLLSRRTHSLARNLARTREGQKEKTPCGARMAWLRRPLLARTQNSNPKRAQFKQQKHRNSAHFTAIQSNSEQFRSSARVVCESLLNTRDERSPTQNQ